MLVTELKKAGIESNGNVSELVKVVKSATENATILKELQANSKNPNKEVLSLKKEIEDLKANGDNSQALIDLQNKLSNSEKAFTDLELSSKTEISELEIKGANTMLTHLISNSLPKTDNSFDVDIIDTMRTRAISEIMKVAKLGDDGLSIVLRNENNDIITNPDNANAPYTVSEYAIAKTSFKTIADTGVKQDSFGNLEKNKKTPVKTKLNVTGKTKNEIADMLQEKGITGKDFNEQYRELTTDLN